VRQPSAAFLLFLWTLGRLGIGNSFAPGLSPVFQPTNLYLLFDTCPKFIPQSLQHLTLHSLYSLYSGKFSIRMHFTPPTCILRLWHHATLYL